MTGNATMWQEEQIHAYVDGAMPAELAARLEADCRADAALAERVARQRQVRALLQAQFDPVLDEPVPQRLLNALGTGAADSSVTPIGAARRPLAAPPAWWGALAASLLLGLMLGWWLAGKGALPVSSDDGALLARGDLDSALSDQLSGSQGPAGIAVVASLRTADGKVCRAFRLADGADGLACRTDRGWQIDALGSALPQSPAAGDSYRQASSALSASVIAAMEQQQTGEALTPEQEQRARDAGWRDGLL